MSKISELFDSIEVNEKNLVCTSCLSRNRFTVNVTSESLIIVCNTCGTNAANLYEPNQPVLPRYTDATNIVLSKILSIKMIRDLCPGLGLKEAKDFVDTNHDSNGMSTVQSLIDIVQNMRKPVYTRPLKDIFDQIAELESRYEDMRVRFSDMPDGDGKDSLDREMNTLEVQKQALRWALGNQTHLWE